MDKSDVERAIAEKSILIWAYKYRKIRTGGSWENYTIKDYPYLKGVFHAIQSPEVDRTVVQKGTQLGVTEAAISAMLYFLDTKGENVLYMLPKQSGQLGDFAHSRLDKVIEKSPYLDQLFNDVSNVGLKVSQKGSIYLRGSGSAAQLEEFPAGFVIRDEITRMDQSVANLAYKRLGSSRHGWKLDLSHPTFEGDLISSSFAESSRHRWVYRCPNCGEVQPVDFFDNYYNRGNELGCRACGESWAKTDVVEEGFWQAQGDPENPLRGFHLSRILSPVESLENMASEYEEAKVEGDFKLQQFYNTQLGQPWTAEGDRIAEKTIRELMNGPEMAEAEADGAILGVDTGKPLYWSVLTENQVLAVGRATKFKRLKDILSKYNVKTCLFDAMPEPHAVENFIDDLPDGVDGWMVRTKGTGDIGTPKVKSKDNEIKAHAVWLFDNLFSQINSGELTLPRDLPSEAVEHLTNPVRVVEEDRRGNPKPTYEKGVCHFADAIKFGILANSDELGIKRQPRTQRWQQLQNKATGPIAEAKRRF